MGMSFIRVTSVSARVVYSVDGVGLAVVVAYAQDVEGRDWPKQLTFITFEDALLVSDTDTCSLHLHFVTIPHNFGCIFSPAHGL